VLIHHYVILIGGDGRPRAMMLTLRKPDGSDVRTYDARLADDSVSITVSPDTAPPRRLRATRAFPFLGASMAPMELALATLRVNAHADDSTGFAAVPITGPFVAQSLPIFFFGQDSARVGNTQARLIAHFDHAGHVVDVTSSSGAVKRVGPFDLDALTARAAAAAGKPR
jgi:hypothetical protein